MDHLRTQVGIPDRRPVPQNDPPSPPHILIRPPTLVERDEPSQPTNNRGYHSSTTQPKSTSRPTSPSKYLLDEEGLPKIEDGEQTPYSLQTLLRMCQTRTPDGRVGFWTLKLLRRIFSRERLRAQVQKDIDDKRLELGSTITIDDIINAIHPRSNPSTVEDKPEDKTHYTRIYALLVLCENSHLIARFIERGESDMILPVTLRPPDEPDWTYRLESEFRPDLTGFNSLPEHLRHYVESEQWKVLTPYFDLDAGNRARHRHLPDKTILPWCQLTDRDNSSNPSDKEGGYGFVSIVKIHPTSHGFRRILQAIQLNDELFALKKLRVATTRDNQTAFQNELDNLNRFSGLVHDHLVTLLATFTLENQYHFLFPYAEFALDEYWEKNPEPVFDLTTVRWVSKQMLGIMAAVDTIHEPRHVHLLPSSGEKRYGRHGDIKPDNILWFKSGRDPLGILVVSDMGLTSFNRDVSRSNIPGHKIPGAPGYRPPECEVKGGKVSRAFDIWTLGCLFLELTTWLLGGYKLLAEFENERMTPYITGTRSNVFFDIKEYDMPGGGTGNVAQVKREVTWWFVKLHANKHCSKFVHDVLDKIEREMLIVLSQDEKTGKRSLSGPLRDDFRRMYRRCMDNENTDYAMRPAPERREFREAVPVEAELATVTRETMGRRRLDTYNGRRQPSMTEEAMARMDELPGQVQDLSLRAD